MKNLTLFSRMAILTLALIFILGGGAKGQEKIKKDGKKSKVHIQIEKDENGNTTSIDTIFEWNGDTDAAEFLLQEDINEHLRDVAKLKADVLKWHDDKNRLYALHFSDSYDSVWRIYHDSLVDLPERIRESIRMQIEPEMLNIDFLEQEWEEQLEEINEQIEEGSLERPPREFKQFYFGIPDMQGIGSWMEYFPVDKIKRFEVKDKKGYKKIILEVGDDGVFSLRMPHPPKPPKIIITDRSGKRKIVPDDEREVIIEERIGGDKEMIIKRMGKDDEPVIIIKRKSEGNKSSAPESPPPPPQQPDVPAPPDKL